MIIVLYQKKQQNRFSNNLKRNKMNKNALFGLIVFILFGMGAAFSYYIGSKGVICWLLVSAFGYGIWLINSIKEN